MSSLFYLFSIHSFNFLFIASQNGHNEVVKELLDKRASVNWCDYTDGQNALHHGLH